MPGISPARSARSRSSCRRRRGQARLPWTVKDTRRRTSRKTLGHTGRGHTRTRGEPVLMALGYDGKLYILAFDHRGSFQKKMFGIEGDPTAEQTERIADAKRLIFEGMELAVERGVDPHATGVLVDEQFGSDIPKRAKERGLVLSMPVEKSGQDEFDFQFGAQFGDHIKKFDVHFAKVLVRYNPDGEPGMNQ